MAGTALPGIPGPSIAQHNAVTIATAASTSYNNPSCGLVQPGVRDVQVLIQGMPPPQNDSSVNEDVNIMGAIVLMVGLFKFLKQAVFLGPVAVGSIRRLVSSNQAALDLVNPELRMPARGNTARSYLLFHICVIAHAFVLELNWLGVTVVLVHQPAHCHATDADAHNSNAADRCAHVVDERDSSTYTHVVDVSRLDRRVAARELLAALVISPPLRSSWQEMAGRPG